MIAKSHSSVRPKLPLAGAISILSLSGLAFVLASGGGESLAAPRGGESAPAASVGAGTPTVSAETYTAAILLPPTIPLGKESIAEVTITPKAGYKINKQYPFKFRTADPPPENVGYARTTYAFADGQFSDKLGVFKVRFTPKSAGQVTIGGKLSLSVCSDANCVMDKVDLEVTVDAR